MSNNVKRVFMSVGDAMSFKTYFPFEEKTRLTNANFFAVFFQRQKARQSKVKFNFELKIIDAVSQANRKRKRPRTKKT